MEFPFAKRIASRIVADEVMLAVSLGAYMILVLLFVMPALLKPKTFPLFLSPLGLPFNIVAFAFLFVLIVILVPIGLSEVIYHKGRLRSVAFLIYLTVIGLLFAADYDLFTQMPNIPGLFSSGLVVAGMIAVWVVLSYRALYS